MKNKFTKPLSHVYASDMPDLNASSEDIVFVASVEDIAKALPSHDARKRILATDALASVDGFRIMVQLTCFHIYGAPICCQNCPDCDCSEGGILGRVDEAKK